MMVTTQAGESVQCQCPDCVIRQEHKAARSAMYPVYSVLSPQSASKMWGPHTYDVADMQKHLGVSKMWGYIAEPKAEPIAPPPINWLTHQKPLTDTVEQRAAFLKKQGLACPTEITPDDIEAIGRIR